MFYHRLLLPDGSVIASGTDQRPALQQVNLTRKVNTQEALNCGSVCAAMVELTLLCQDGVMPIHENDALTLLRVYDDGRQEQQGIFLVCTPERTGKGTYRVTGYDFVSLLDKDVTLWLAALQGWPYSLLQLAQMVCQQCGVALLNQEIPNGNFSVNAFSGGGITGRMLMGWIGEAAGCFCRANVQGQLEFAWYTPRDLTLAPQSEAYYFQGSCSHQTYQVKPIDQVQLRQDSRDVGITYPQDIVGQNVYIVEGNPLLSAPDGDALLPIARKLYEQMSTVTYTPCQVSVPGHLQVQPGEIIQVMGKDGQSLTMYVMEVRRAGRKDTLVCTGPYARQSGEVANRYHYKALSGKVLHLQMDVDGLQAENLDAAGRLARVELDLDGIRTTVKSQTEQTDVLKEQVFSLTQNSQQVQMRIQEITENGAGKVKTETGYTFDKEGLKISKSGEEMENRLDNTGMYVRRSGQTILQANNQGVIARDVAVQNYLIVGDHARFEDYDNGTDQRRTACYWIGG